MLVAGALAVAGCGSTVPGIPSAAAGSAATPDPSPATPDPAPAAAPTGAPAPARDDLLVAALLRPSEMGPRWSTAADRPAPDGSTPAVCGGPNVVNQYPDAHRIGTALTSKAGERMQETLSVFADASTAQAAFGAYGAGLACEQGKLGATDVTVTPPEDVTAQVQGDQATAWTIKAGTFDAVLVSAVAGERLVNFVFLTPRGGTLTRLDALALARTGVARLLAT